MPTTPRTSQALRARAPAVVLAALLAGATLTGCAAGRAGAAAPTGPSVVPGTAEAAAPTGAPPVAPSTSAPAVASSAPGPTPAVVVTVDDFAYQVPASVAPGATVEVHNVDVETHTLTSSDAGAFAVTVPVDARGSFVAPGLPGAYRFFCLLHGGMEGVLVVG